MIPSLPPAEPPPTQRYTRADFDHSPFVVFYEVTQACDLVCLHCRACAQTKVSPDELSPSDSLRLLDQLASFPTPPLVVLTGGDPMKRPDLVDMVRHGVALGLRMALTPSATPLVTRERLETLQAAGLSRLAVSLDGVDAATHDAFRGFPGTYERVWQIIRDARAIGLPIQVNTTITRHNVAQIEAMADLLERTGIVLWSVFFLVPVGRAQADDRISPEQYEQVFERLWRNAKVRPYAIKTTEAMHYRRFVGQRERQPWRVIGSAVGEARRPPPGMNDGKGVMFVGHAGLIHPSGFLPLTCGMYPHDSVVDVYQRSPIFRALRDADRLEGKCGACEWKHICGGSRARAYAVTGNLFAQEPDCVYQPAGWEGT